MTTLNNLHLYDHPTRYRFYLYLVIPYWKVTLCASIWGSSYGHFLSVELLVILIFCTYICCDLETTSTYGNILLMAVLVTPNLLYRKKVEHKWRWQYYTSVYHYNTVNLHQWQVFFLYKSNEGCFPFIFHHFVWFISYINPYIIRDKKILSNIQGYQWIWKASIFNLWFLRQFCMDFYATRTNRSTVTIPF